MKLSPGAKVVLILFALSMFGGIVTGAQFYYRIGYFWAFLFIGSWLWSLTALRGLRLQRKERTLRAQVGQIFEERFEVDNPNSLPRFLVNVRDESPLPGSQGSRVFPIIERKLGRSYLVRTQLVQRGVFPLGPTVLESGDPFGLFPVERIIKPEESLMVYPMMIDIRTFPTPPGIIPGGEALRRRTVQVTPNAAGVRDYAPGDPLNRIHWLSTARRGRLIAKEFELDPQADVWVFLDAEKASNVSSKKKITFTDNDERDALWRVPKEISLPPATEEYGVSIAASLCRYYLRKGRSVGFASAGQSVTVLPPDKGGRQLAKILESLALIRAEGKLPLPGLIRAQVQHLARGTTVVLVTASVEQEIALAVDLLIRRGLRPLVVLIDAASFGGISGTGVLEQMLLMMNVIVRTVKNGDTLEVILPGNG
ncbi:MAG: DUF58 domain-containing protein [Anaerolineales bacterium]|nr:DUF58 domain-containing protein [Anaerolineales bacterium]